MNTTRSDDSPITVYSFRVIGVPVESPTMAGFKATLQAIEALQGEPLHGTAEDVDSSELDELGHDRRRNTAWAHIR